MLRQRVRVSQEVQQEQAKRREEKDSSVDDVFRWPEPLCGHECPYDLRSFIERIAKYSLASPQAHVWGLALIDRLADKSLHRVNAGNVHLLILVGIVVASKLLDDNFASNKRYAEIGGQSRESLNDMELRFLLHLDWDITLDPAVYVELESAVLCAGSSGQPVRSPASQAGSSPLRRARSKVTRSYELVESQE